MESTLYNGPITRIEFTTRNDRIRANALLLWVRSGTGYFESLGRNMQAMVSSNLLPFLELAHVGFQVLNSLPKLRSCDIPPKDPVILNPKTDEEYEDMLLASQPPMTFGGKLNPSPNPDPIYLNPPYQLSDESYQLLMRRAQMSDDDWRKDD